MEEYVEKVPNPSLKSEWGTWGASLLSFPRLLGWCRGDRVGFCPNHQPDCLLTAFKPIDLSDLKRRNTQDAKKS